MTVQNTLLKPVHITRHELDKLGQLIFSETGIRLGGNKKDLVVSRLMKRLRELGLKNFTDYYNYLIDDPCGHIEIINMISRITTHKTEFFRESHHFDYLRNHVFPEMLQRTSAGDKRVIRIWSAACSTGEEPYTIAIVASEFCSENSCGELKILASDIDCQVLNYASKGIYTSDQMKYLQKNIVAKYFKKGVHNNNGLYMVKESLKNYITFKKINLMDSSYPIHSGLDVIFCRNVLIYFDKNIINKLVNKFYHLLADGGFLFIGHAESLREHTDKFVSIGNTIYQKKG